MPQFYLTDHTAEGWTPAYWRRPGLPAPFTDGSVYQIDSERAQDLVRRAGSDAPIVDLENFPADGEERIAAFERAVGLVRTEYGDSRRLRKNRRPILYYGLFPEAGLWPLHVLDERAGVPRDRREIGRRMRGILHVAELANSVSIGLYLANGPDREVDGVLIPSIKWEIERAVATAELWELLAPDIPRFPWVIDTYVFQNPGQAEQSVTDADLATLAAAVHEHTASGLWSGAIYWTPREPDARFLKLFR